MKKKTWISLLAVGALAGAAIVTISLKSDGSATAVLEPKTAPQATATTVATSEMPVVHYELSRDRAYNSLQELKDDAKFIVVADFLKKQPSRLEGHIVETHNDFIVKKVFKGPQELEGTEITVNETGGIYEGKKYLAEDNEELFDEGEYLLFLDKGDKYFVDGGGSGKFKLSTVSNKTGKFDSNANYLNTKLKAYGIDKVRNEVEKSTGKELLNKLK